MAGTIGTMGKRGTFVIPAKFRQLLGLNDGDLVLCEMDGDRFILRKARAVPAEAPSKERRAEFMLNSAIDAEDYARARTAVVGLGLDPDTIPHERPPGT